MLIQNRTLSSITEVDLLDLIANQVAEGKLVDYKLTLPGNSDEDKKEFLYDVSSFANTAGGHLVFGMDEMQGIASNLSGINNLDPDKEKLRLDNIIRDGIAPRINGIAIQSIYLENGNVAIVIYVPKSWSAPHMVTFKGASRFYARNSAGKYPLDVQEIRQAFLLSDTISQKISNFRLNRIAQINAGEIPIPLINKARLVLHIIPLTSFQSFETVDFNQVTPKFFEYFPEASSRRFNLDGFVAFREKTRNQGASYFQIFRNGHIEFTSGDFVSHFDDGQEYVPSVSAEQDVIKACEVALNVQKVWGLGPPILVFMGLCGVKNIRYATSLRVNAFSENLFGFDRDPVLLPEILLEKYPLDLDEIASELQPLFNAFANAAGFERSFSYNQDGLWRPRPY